MTTTTTLTRAAALAALDHIEDLAAELGLRLAEDEDDITPSVMADIHSTVRMIQEQLRRVLARLPGEEGPQAN
jgi:hypothetical protein